MFWLAKSKFYRYLSIRYNGIGNGLLYAILNLPDKSPKIWHVMVYMVAFDRIWQGTIQPPLENIDCTLGDDFNVLSY